MSSDKKPSQFRLVNRDDLERGHSQNDANAALKQLEQPKPAPLEDFYKRLNDFRASNYSNYQLNDKLETAINMALAVGAPLLLTGEPGTGKTTVAYFLKWYFGTEIFEYQVRSTSTAEDMKYDFDAVSYLQAAYRSALAKQPEPDRSDPKFLHPKALWLAFQCKTTPVLLIDEIDKAPRDFPNDLLQELDKHEFKHPFKEELINPSSVKPPIVVITSNEERRLPDAFLRRCIYHNIEMDEGVVRRAVDFHFKELDENIRKTALKRFSELRDKVVGKKPSTAEVLVWLAILSIRGVELHELEQPDLSKLPAINALVKEKADLDRLGETG